MIYDVFYISLLEKNTTRKRRVNKKTFPELKKEFEAGDNKEYQVKVIIDSKMYG